MTINLKGNLINLSTPKVMGILNITPDSFYDGGDFRSDKSILLQVEKMLTEGANLIDIGGQSSRPNAKLITWEEELQRVLTPIQSILKEFPETPISIDTFYSQVAEQTVDAGVAMINDISAGSIDTNMFETVGRLNVPYVLMHMQGSPETMQNKPKYNNIINDIIYFLSERIAKLRAFGVNDIIVDPGFGFGKTLEDNYSILNNLDLFSVLETPLLIGASRKSMIYNLLNSSPQEALNGTTVVNTISLSKGANILRVHDVKEAVECVKITTFANEL